MVKKTVTLDGLLNSDPPKAQTQEAPQELARVKKTAGGKRVTVALDPVTYRRLRLYAANTDLTHQTILNRALADYLNNANA